LLCNGALPVLAAEDAEGQLALLNAMQKHGDQRAARRVPTGTRRFDAGSQEAHFVVPGQRWAMS